MTHEFKDIVAHYLQVTSKGKLCALVTVVALNGSSYRKPGVRMLIDSSGGMTGAVRGGCVEKEIQNKAQSVFANHLPVMMTYDGRYRIGCEGLLYILIEPFAPKSTFIDAFYSAIENRWFMEFHSYYQTTVGAYSNIGTEVIINQLSFSVSETILTKNQPCFAQVLPPCYRLYIAGIEHDAQHLCRQAALLGWEVVVLKSLDQFHDSQAFPDALHVKAMDPSHLSELSIDGYTSFVLMSHNFARDLNYLLQLSSLTLPLYIGVLGSTKRMEQLFSDLLDRQENVSEAFMDRVQGPAGIAIKAITPPEIAISILAQIIAKQRNIPELTPSYPPLLAHEL